MESPNQFNSGVLAVDKSFHPLFPGIGFIPPFLLYFRGIESKVLRTWVLRRAVLRKCLGHLCIFPESA